MNNDFPIIVTMLRKERGLSQKQAASDLGISQALLSHYEKGIRECGLDFLIKTAEYYNVSCDYLLGRTPDRITHQLRPSDLPDAVTPAFESSGNMVAMIDKKVIINTTSVIFEILNRLGNKKLTNAVSSYLMNAQYQVFRSIYSCEDCNPQELFTLSKSKYKSLCSAAMTLDLALIDAIIENKTENTSIALSPDLISKYFEKGAASLFTLVRNAEKGVKSKFRQPVGW